MCAFAVQTTALHGRTSAWSDTTFAPVPPHTKQTSTGAPRTSRKRRVARSVHASSPYARAWSTFAAASASMTAGCTPDALSDAKLRTSTAGAGADRGTVEPQQRERRRRPRPQRLEQPGLLLRARVRGLEHAVHVLRRYHHRAVGIADHPVARNHRRAAAPDRDVHPAGSVL